MAVVVLQAVVELEVWLSNGNSSSRIAVSANVASVTQRSFQQQAVSMQMVTHIMLSAKQQGQAASAGWG
jgi:hypothetical protein